MSNKLSIHTKPLEYKPKDFPGTTIKYRVMSEIESSIILNNVKRDFLHDKHYADYLELQITRDRTKELTQEDMRIISLANPACVQIEDRVSLEVIKSGHVVGWEGVTGENDEELLFDSELLLNFPMDILAELHSLICPASEGEKSPKKSKGKTKKAQGKKPKGNTKS